MNHYPVWKYWLVGIITCLGLLYALPNLFGEDEAVQISGLRGSTLTAELTAKMLAALDQAKLAPLGQEAQPGGALLLRFTNPETQLKAASVVREAVGNDYVVALNLAPRTPGWLQAIGAKPMYLGLDLRGGVHFLLEIDMVGALEQAMERYAGELRARLRDAKLRYSTVTREGVNLRIGFRNPEDAQKAYTLIRDGYTGLAVTQQPAGEETALHLQLTEAEQKTVKKFALQQNLTTLRNRVNELGVAEPLIQQQGEGRIVVELPGVQDTARAKEILGATATLEFRLVDTEHDLAGALAGKVPPTARLYRDREGRPVLLKRQVIVTGDQITDAASGIDQQSGTPSVFISLDGVGAKRMNDTTRENIGKPMSVVFIETRDEEKMQDGQSVKTPRKIEEVINTAVIRSQFSQRFQITGLDSSDEAHTLALLLRAGALAAPMRIIEERTVGPSLGQENIQLGTYSALAGMIMVLIFMATYYRLSGWIANAALILNLVLVIALLSLFQATLTLPGIAGIVLGIGMAVDANVLIFERIREELRNGNTPHASIEAGYDKAYSAIMDANITTVIAAALLFSFGTGPVKGFAVTLVLGILTSMFTAITGTRAVFSWLYGQRRINKLSI